MCKEIGSIVPKEFIKDMWNATANNPLFFSFQNWMNKEERSWWKRRRKLFASTARETINTVKRGRTSRKQTWLILLPDGFSHHSDIAENRKRRNLSWKWYSWYFQGGWPRVGAAGPGPDFLPSLDHTEPIPAPDKNKENLEKDFSSIGSFEAISNLTRQREASLNLDFCLCEPWMKRIVIKMRSFKKLFGGDLLQLALLLSLLKVSYWFKQKHLLHPVYYPTHPHKHQL